MKYYDPTTGDFSPESTINPPSINPVDLPYYNPMTGQQEVERKVESVPLLKTLDDYDPRWDEARHKRHPQIDVESLPYYERRMQPIKISEG